MKKNLQNAAFATPYFSETESRQVGQTPDKRAVWQSNSGPPFLIVYDTKNAQHLLPVNEPWEELPHPHKTFAEMSLNAETPAPVGSIRGPFTTGDPRKPCVAFMVQGRGGRVTITRPKRSRDEQECRRAAKAYALKILTEAATV